MPYTAAQLTQYYTSINGTAPDQATSLSFAALAQQNANGTLSDASTLRFAINSGQTLATTDVALATYQFFTGQAPSVAGLAYLRGDTGSGNTAGFNTATYNGTGQVNGGAASATNVAANGFDLENRYYNQAVALSLDPTAGASFRSNYGTLTLAQTVQVAYETVIGQSNVTPANYQGAIANITAAIPYFTSVAQRQAGTLDGAGTTVGQNIALKAVIVGYILEEGLKQDVGTYANAIDQFNASTAAGNNPDPASGATGVNLLTTFAPGGSAFGTGVGATSSNSGGVNGGTTTGTALTPNVETVSGSTFNGGLFFNAPSGTYLQTLNSGDVLNGSAGTTNTLNVTFGNNGNLAATTARQVVLPTLNNITNVNIVDLDTTPTAANAALGQGGTNLNLANSSAVKNINVSSSTGPVNVTNNVGALTSLTIGTVAGNQVLVTSSGVALAGTTDTLALNVGTNTATTNISAAGYEIVNLSATGSNNAAGTLNTINFADANLTTLNITGGVAVSLPGQVGGATTALTTINAGGTAAVAAMGTTAAVPAVAGPTAVTVGNLAGSQAIAAATGAYALGTDNVNPASIGNGLATAAGLGASNLTYTGSTGNDTVIFSTGLNAQDTLNGNGGADTVALLAGDNPAAALAITNFQTIRFYDPTPSTYAFGGTTAVGGSAVSNTVFQGTTVVDRAFFGTAATTIDLGTNVSDTASLNVTAGGVSLTVKNLISGNTVGFDYDSSNEVLSATGTVVTTPTANANPIGNLITTLATDGTTDVINLNLRDTDSGSTYGSLATMTLLTTTGFETVNLNLGGGGGVANVAPGANNTANIAQQNTDTLAITGISDAALTTLKITGATNLTLASLVGSTTSPGLTSLSSVDASAATGNISLGAISVGTAGVVGTAITVNNAFQTVNTGATILTGSGNDLVSIDLGLTGILNTLNLGANYVTPAATAITATTILTAADFGDTLALTVTSAALNGATVVDLSSTTDQITQVLGSANASAQTGIENIDLSGIGGANANNSATVVGSAAANFIVTTNRVDTINAGAGNDVVTGLGGGDNINVGSGTDTLRYLSTVDSSTDGTGGAVFVSGGSTANIDKVVGMGGADRIDFSVAGGVVTQATPQPITGTVIANNGADVLLRGTYSSTADTFTVNGTGPDLLFQHDTNGAGADGIIDVVLVGSAANITSFTSTSAGIVSFIGTAT